jgi:excisionase family DNA binding protein
MNKPQGQSELVGTSTAAELLGVHRHTVRKLVAYGAVREIRYSPRSQPRYLRSELVQLRRRGYTSQEPLARSVEDAW